MQAWQSTTNSDGQDIHLKGITNTHTHHFHTSNLHQCNQFLVPSQKGYTVCYHPNTNTGFLVIKGRLVVGCGVMSCSLLRAAAWSGCVCAGMWWTEELGAAGVRRGQGGGREGSGLERKVSHSLSVTHMAPCQAPTSNYLERHQTLRIGKTYYKSIYFWFYSKEHIIRVVIIFIIN